MRLAYRSGLDDRESGCRVHRGPAVPQDRHTAAIIPVVQDALEQIQVAAGGNGSEEVVGHELATSGDAVRGRVAAGKSQHPQAFAEHAPQAGVCLKERGQYNSLAPADADHRLGAAD